MIYADNAATTKLDIEAFEAMKPWLLDEYGNASGAYSFSRKPKKALQEARETIAQCINAMPEEIYFTSGGTESDNWAIKGIALSSKTPKTILTSAIEHHAILHSCKAIAHLGYPIKYMQPLQNGVIAPSILEENIMSNMGLVSVMLVNNELGTIQPIEDLAAIAHNHDILFHTDAVQAVGHIEIDVKRLGVDLLSASAHKFNGPKGIGFLYVRKGTKLLPYLDGGAQESGMRAGTENVANIVGMAVALRNNVVNVRANQKYVKNLEQQFFQILTENNINYIRNGGEETIPGLISLSFDGKSGETILHRMDLMGINISTGSACNSHSIQISHVLRAIHLSESLAKGTIRISLGKDNTEEDVKVIVSALEKILSMSP